MNAVAHVHSNDCIRERKNEWQLQVFLLWISAYKDCMEGCRAHSPKLRMERWWVPQHRHVSWNAWGTADLSIRRWWNSKPPPQPWRNQNSLTFMDPPPLQAGWRSLQSILSCTKSTKEEYKRDTKRVVKRVIKCHQMSLPPWSQRSNSHRRNRMLSQTSRFFPDVLPVFGGNHFLAELRHQHSLGSLLEGNYHLHFRIDLPKFVWTNLEQMNWTGSESKIL